MIAIQLRFPTGKWHATPWGRQVNEGAVEWPPSPWRLLRALLAVWHHKFPNVPAEEVRSLVDALTPLPVYQLPPASQGHTRHYMKIGPDKDNPGGKPTKIFDTFVSVSPAASLIVLWPNVTLDAPQRQLLSRLLAAMSYFGRAESWVDAELLDDWDGTPNAVPLNDHGVGDRQELVRLLAPSPQEDYGTWRERMIDESKTRKLDEKKEKARQKGKSDEKETSLPTSIFDALHAETNDVRGAGWNRPPGSRWVDYVRSQDAFAPQVRSRRQKRKHDCPTVARYAVASAVRPLLTDAIFIGERIRTAVMSQSRRLHQKNQNDEQVHAAPVFSGKSADGTTSSGHLHSHFLSEARTSDRRVSHITVYAPMGFDRNDELALTRLRGVWGDGGHDLQLVLLGIGEPGDFGGTDEKKGQSRILACSPVWVSRTPFVPTDHLRIRDSEKRDPQRLSMAEQRELDRIVRKELSRREWMRKYVDAVQIERVPHTYVGGTKTTWLKFRRDRNKGSGRKSSSYGYGFRLIFPEPVQGPIALGLNQANPDWRF